MDLAIGWDADELLGDLLVRDNDLATDECLRSAVFISLFTDKRATLEDLGDDDEADLRGWWGDSYPSVPGDQLGSHLWLLERELQTPAVLDRARSYARDALAWLLEDEIATRVSVTTSYPQRGVLAIDVDIQSACATAERLQYQVDGSGCVRCCGSEPTLPGEIRSIEPTYFYLVTPPYPVRVQEGATAAPLVLGGRRMQGLIDYAQVTGAVAYMKVAQTYFPVEQPYVGEDGAAFEAAQVRGQLVLISVGQTYVPIDYTAWPTTTESAQVTGALVAISVEYSVDYYPVDYGNWDFESMQVSGALVGITNNGDL